MLFASYEPYLMEKIQAINIHGPDASWLSRLGNLPCVGFEIRLFLLARVWVSNFGLALSRSIGVSSFNRVRVVNFGTFGMLDR